MRLRVIVKHVDISSASPVVKIAKRTKKYAIRKIKIDSLRKFI